MTSGLPPDAPERRRAGGFVPGAVPSTGWLPFFVVLLGTVLLSGVLGGRRRHVPRWAGSLAGSLRPPAGPRRAPPPPHAGGRAPGGRCHWQCHFAPRRATVGHRPDATRGGDPSWARRHPRNVGSGRLFPHRTSRRPPWGGHPVRVPATTPASASSVGRFRS